MSLVTISRTPKSGEPHKPDASFRLRMERLEDRDNPAATLVSSTSAFDGANAAVQILAASDDGQEILVQSTATNLIPGQVDVPGTNDLFYFNFTNGQRSLITAAAPSAALGVTIGTKALGAEISTPGVLLKAVISGDGSAVKLWDAAPEMGEERVEESWRVYDREGKPCLRCAAPIVRIVQAGRSTFYCRRCQR